MAKVWKLLYSLFLRYPTAFSQNTFLLRKWFSFVPRTPEQRCLEYQYTKLGRWTYFGQIPLVPEQRCLEYQYTKLGRWTYFGQWTPQYQSRDALNTSTQTWQMNLLWPMELPPINREEMPCMPLHKTWQMNLFWPMDPPVPEQRWLAYCSSIHHFWDTPQHFLKAHFCLESGFLSFLVLQIFLLVSFQGCWIQWQRFESSSIHHFWDTPQHFLKTHFCLESGFLLFLELQKSLLVSFHGCWTQWQRFESSSIHQFLRYPTAFSQKTFLLREWLSCVPRTLEISTSKFSGVLNTVAKVWKL